VATNDARLLPLFVTQPIVRDRAQYPSGMEDIASDAVATQSALRDFCGRRVGAMKTGCTKPHIAPPPNSCAKRALDGLLPAPRVSRRTLRAFVLSDSRPTQSARTVTTSDTSLFFLSAVGVTNRAAKPTGKRSRVRPQAREAPAANPAVKPMLSPRVRRRKKARSKNHKSRKASHTKQRARLRAPPGDVSGTLAPTRVRPSGAGSKRVALGGTTAPARQRNPARSRKRLKVEAPPVPTLMDVLTGSDPSTLNLDTSGVRVKSRNPLMNEALGKSTLTMADVPPAHGRVH
jgi:hypothetical protein